ncbi:hypothetical protein IQ259_22315 [Fortiea sp. LEGE XX443]|uniref:WD40 repeat domain-containing protein n=1 Tax=Fortiea sp. LEGE XX443 TaxID=1828611 RepID=UPI00187FDC95|nr:WD40 repeat domain-containing protein [Fortiea sp. LEGE XX443]MBE9007719.1 hypothetical protein [Fortiea sp. LEGE XX443]
MYALAQTSRSEGINKFNVNSPLGYEFWSPILRGIGGGIVTFFRQFGQGAGKGVKSIVGKTGEAGGNSAGIRSLAISPDGHTLVNGSGDESIKIWRDN